MFAEELTMTRSSVRCRHRLIAGVAIAALSITGCTGFDVGPLEFFSAATPEPPLATAADADTFEVDLFAEGQKPIRVKLPLNGPTYVQGALEASGATKRFQKMKVMVVRSAPESGTRHKLDVDYVSKKGRVSPTTDYALHPKDRVVVIEDATGVLDEMFGATKPLGRALPFGK
jgi:hypothetical protein